jgi:hypothetical protein
MDDWIDPLYFNPKKVLTWVEQWRRGSREEW